MGLSLGERLSNCSALVSIFGFDVSRGDIGAGETVALDDFTLRRGLTNGASLRPPLTMSTSTVLVGNVSCAAKNVFSKKVFGARLSVFTGSWSIYASHKKLSLLILLQR